MVRYKRILGVFVILLLCVSTLGNYVTVGAKAKAVPKIIVVEEAKREYEVGERLYVKVQAPNYKEKVEYRAVIWDGNAKKALNVWTNYPYYYKNWQPAGTTVFPITWIVSTPGVYRLTVYVRRLGSKVPYDSYVETKAFVVKEKQEIAKEMVIDKDNETYDGKYIEKKEAIKTDVRLTAKNVVLKNAAIEGNVYITGDNVSLSNVLVSGKVVIDPGKNGTANLDNVTAKTVDVLSGGTESIHLKDFVAEEMNAGGENPIRIEIDGNTKILATKAKSNLILVVKSGTFGKITIEKQGELETKIEFQGNFEEEIIVKAASYLKAADKANIKKLIVSVDKREYIVKLEGKFASVEVNKETRVILLPNTVISLLTANANFDLEMDKNSKVEKLENKGGKPLITGAGAGNVNTGAISGGGGSGSGGSSSGGSDSQKPEVRVSGVGLDTSSAIMKIGQTISIEEEVYPSNAANKDVEWSSSNTSIAEVNNGEITAKREGTAVIKVKTKDGGYMSSMNVKVTKFDFCVIIRRSDDMVTFSVYSARSNDEVTLSVLDINGNKKYAEQKTLEDNIIVFTIPLEKGSYKCCIKSLDTDIIEINI